LDRLRLTLRLRGGDRRRGLGDRLRRTGERDRFLGEGDLRRRTGLLLRGLKFSGLIKIKKKTRKNGFHVFLYLGDLRLGGDLRLLGDGDRLFGGDLRRAASLVFQIAVFFENLR
jgi:hypothetical protein